MFRPRLRIPRPPRTWLAVKTHQRSVQHYVPTLKFKADQGVPDFLGPEAFKVAWTEYETLQLSKINSYVAGTPWERDSLKDLVLKTAREPRHASLFNYASAAHNNHFFFEGLASEQTTMPSRLEEDLQRSFGSVQTLKEELTLTARGMFGPGFVWLVRAERVGDPESFRVLATYLAGSPYPGAHWRRQPYDMNTVDNRAPLPAGDAVIAAMRPPPGDPVEYLERRHQGSWGRVPDAAKFAPGGIDLVPVLCVNMWEHVWVHDYGVFREGVDGKANYLENWWNRINWNIVAERASGRARTSTLKTTSVSSR